MGRKKPIELPDSLKRLRGPALAKALAALTPEQLDALEGAVDLPDAGYAKIKERAAERSRLQSLKGRDIGPIPAIADIERRASCRPSLALFCKTYNPKTFYLPWSSYHRKAIARIEEAVFQGALYAFSMPRGSGKTAICRMAALWALSNGLLRYAFNIGSTTPKAEETLDAIKKYIRFLPLFAADFPEISAPARRLGGISNKAGGQLCQGVSTSIVWAQDRLFLPTVPPPANWPSEWPLRSDGMVPSSGGILMVSGLTGEGIRGSLLTLTTGESVRPDLVLLDDPQTDESAGSANQCNAREELVAGAVLGMASPDRSLSALMCCTPIRRGDMADRILDRAKHPLWRGERTKMLTTMPSDMAAWDAYFELFARCAHKEPPDFTESNVHYVEHRAELDEGAEASWPEKHKATEISAIQAGMHLYFRSPTTFWAEAQGEPLDPSASTEAQLDPDQIAARLNRHDRGALPAATTRVTAFVDVQGTLLYYVVCAWDDRFGGAVVDYGAYPRQSRLYYSLREASPTLADAFPGRGLEAQLYAGLEALTGELLTREHRRDDGATMRIERLLIDANWGPSSEVVKKFCRQSAHAGSIYPSHGKGVTAGQNPLTDRAKKPGERFGLNWLIPLPKAGVRYVLFDASWWKMFCVARLTTGIGDPGALVLNGTRPEAHRMFADHLCAEKYTLIQRVAGGREVAEWHLLPGRDNHWWDGLIGCAVAASVQGAALAEMTAGKPQRERKRVSYREAYEAKRAAAR